MVDQGRIRCSASRQCFEFPSVMVERQNDIQHVNTCCCSLKRSGVTQSSSSSGSSSGNSSSSSSSSSMFFDLIAAVSSF